MSLIDLDQPAEEQLRTEPTTRWRVIVSVAAALVVGAVLGGVVAHRWTIDQRRAADERRVSLLAFAGQLSGGTTVDSALAPGGVKQAHFKAAVAVVNVGPLPVNVRSLVAQKPGLTATSAEGTTWVAPGTSFLVEVAVQADCNVKKTGDGTTASIDAANLTVSVAVETLSGSAASVSGLSIDTGPWSNYTQTALTTCLEAG
ncbi:hypothetical protein ACWKSP_03810 [Micromonosporaceae bacterium Da 78-11]